jgi:hypothetical protein
LDFLLVFFVFGISAGSTTVGAFTFSSSGGGDCSECAVCQLAAESAEVLGVGERYIGIVNHTQT